MDVYLASKSDFLIADTAGITNLYRLFRKPLVFVNAVPFSSMFQSSTHDQIVIPKKYWSKSQNRLLTVSEIYQLGADDFSMSNTFDLHNISLIDNTHEEIADAVREMHQYLTHGFDSSKKDDHISSSFYSLINQYYSLDFTNCRVANSFLQNNKHWLI